MLGLVQILKFLIIFVYGCTIGSLSNMLIDRFVERITIEEKALEEGKEVEKLKKKHLYFKNFTYNCGCIRKGVALIPVMG